MNDQTPRPFDDVSRPGVTPAHPNARPVVANGPTYSDPMMTAGQASAMTAGQSSVASPSVDSQLAPALSSEPQPNLVVDQPMTTPVPVPQPSQVSEAEPIHALQPVDPYFGHVGKHKKTKKFKRMLGWTLLAITLLSIAAAVAITEMGIDVSSLGR